MTAATPRPSQFVVNAWDTTAGLPEETILSITQTPDGNLWLANANGLVRYDGSSFETFQPRRDLGGAVKQEISRIGAGPDNTVWVYSTAYGLVRFQNNVFRRAPRYPAPCRVTQIWKDGNGTLVVCAERVLRIVGERVDQLTRDLPGSGQRIQSAARDQNGALWIGLAGGGLAKLDGNGNPAVMYGPEDGMPAAPVNHVLHDGPNRVWAGTDLGLALVSGGRVRLFTTKDGLPSGNIRRLTLGRDGSLWVGTAKGVALYRDGHVGIISSLPSRPVQSLVEDREENVWISFDEINLYRLRKPKFLTWGPFEGLPKDRPRAVVQSGDAIWIAHDTGAWRLKNGKLEEISIGRERLLFLEKDEAGRIWALTENKAFMVDPLSAQFREITFPAPAGKMHSISRDRLGRMWIATGSGLFVGAGGRIKPVTFAGLPPLAARSDVRQSRDGRLWLSVGKVGLFELRDGRAIPVSLGADAELTRIHTFYIDSNNDFWFGLDGGGLARWRNGKLARYGHQIGKPHNFVYYFAEDTEGYLWLGLRAGLLRVEKAGLNAFLDGASAREPRENYYDTADGLSSVNFGGSNRTVASMEPESVLWIPNLLGVVQIDAWDIPVNRMIPPVHVQEISADDRTLAFDEAVSIPAGTRTLKFKFSAPTLVARNRVQIRYRLDPLDATWHNSGLRSVGYSQPPPGQYTFSVTASNNDGVWNEQGTTIKVMVLYRFYQTWWFRLLAAALSAAGICGIYLWRTTQLRRQKAHLEACVKQRTAELSEAVDAAENAAQTKAAFLATMSHEIRTPMHGVLGTLELLAETGLSPEQSDYLRTARNSSDSLLTLLNDILDLSKMEAGRMDLHVAPFCLRQTVGEVARLLQAQAEMRGIALSVDNGENLPEYFEGDEVRVRQIVFNLAANAVKFTLEGRVAIEISGQPQPDGLWSLRMAVRDTGIGIPADRIPELFQQFVQVSSAANRRFAGSGLGLAICQRLAAMMNASISVESAPGSGSTFTLLVELPQATPLVGPKQPTEPILTKRCFDAHILVAEDNRVNQRLAIGMLTRLGCRVTVAQNGREAVTLAEQQKFALILMDCQMPEMDGFEASRLIRASLGDEPVIIAITANSLSGDRERCMQAGMNDYLAKPFKQSDLARLLDRYLPAVPSDAPDLETTFSPLTSNRSSK